MSFLLQPEPGCLEDWQSKMMHFAHDFLTHLVSTTRVMCISCSLQPKPSCVPNWYREMLEGQSFELSSAISSYVPLSTVVEKRCKKISSNVCPARDFLRDSQSKETTSSTKKATTCLFHAPIHKKRACTKSMPVPLNKKRVCASHRNTPLHKPYKSLYKSIMHVPSQKQHANASVQRIIHTSGLQISSECRISKTPLHPCSPVLLVTCKKAKEIPHFGDLLIQ